MKLTGNKLKNKIYYRHTGYPGGIKETTAGKILEGRFPERVVEKAIEEAAKAQLFELNDEITRNVFKGIIEPFLRNIQSRRGITDFLVVCDSSNNTSAVIDNNEFVADIYIQPTRSINFITLTFVATRTGISFSEVIAS